MQAAKQACQVLSNVTLAQDVIMIVENDPGSQLNMKFSSQHFELIADDTLMTNGLQHMLLAVNRSSDKVPGVIEVDVRRMMVGHAISEINPAEASTPRRSGVEALSGVPH